MILFVPIFFTFNNFTYILWCLVTYINLCGTQHKYIPEITIIYNYTYTTNIIAKIRNTQRYKYFSDIIITVFN